MRGTIRIPLNKFKMVLELFCHLIQRHLAEGGLLYTSSGVVPLFRFPRSPKTPAPSTLLKLLEDLNALLFCEHAK